MARFPHGVAVTVHRPGGVDQFGDPDPGSPPTTHVLTGCAVAPRSTSENDARGATVIIGLSLYADHDADIGPADKVEVDGVRYEVVGEPGRWRNPYTANKAGLEVALQRVTG